ncbi:hypothetical protein [Aestuariivirga litoralis]|uniref:hypothetical protein n=1 Tax=Aestuariivirga litoralis TaxID=2650924 RepID=UPI0011B4BE97|nr:hypothetical protein [Aestuariivirga litoralis]
MSRTNASDPVTVSPLLHLPESAWPELDRAAFANAFDRSHDVFDDQGRGARLKPSTRDSIRYGYRRWLGWLSSRHPALLAAPPETRASPEMIRAFVAHLRETCSPRTVASQIGRLHDGLRFMFPARGWTWFKAIKTRLERAVPAAGRKPIEITSQRLIDASLARMDAVDLALATTVPGVSRKHLQALALRYRDALLVAIATFSPLRRTNLSQLELGTTFRREPSGWVIRIPGDLVKNGEPAEADLEDWLNIHVDRYLAVYRPLIFASQHHQGLWASARGRPATGDALYNAFQAEAKASLGLHLTLHDTRRIGVTTWAVHDPVNAAGARDLLGDRSDRILAQHYNLASGIQASRNMAKVIGSLKGCK